ncbi:hypothetical protein FACS18949_03510 [Clostridia bacterium]|nr:hypothetical protein FACS18949_03510 [Clostridia bacterium]
MGGDFEVDELGSYNAYEEYLALPEDVRAEFVNSRIIMMAQPTVVHQRIQRQLTLQLGGFLHGKHCELFTAPIGVHLTNKRGKDEVFEPDLIVVCDKNKLKKDGCYGAPDLIIEILSPSNRGYDRVIKFNKYLQAGVREYWIVDPEDISVNVNILRGGEYVSKAYGEHDDAPVTVLPGCVISLSNIFSLPNGAE